MAIDFDGTGDWLTNANFFRATTEQFTAMGWVYFDALPGNGAYLECFGMSGAKMGAVLTTGGVTVFIIGHAVADIPARTALATGKWYHFAFQCYNSQRRIWVNGYQEVSTTNAEGGATGLVIGDFDGSGLASMNGRISHVRIWTGASALLTGDDVRLEMGSERAIRKEGLRGDYPLGSIGQLSDFSGWGRTLTLAGNPTSAQGPQIVLKSRRVRSIWDVPEAAAAGTAFPHHYYQQMRA